MSPEASTVIENATAVAFLSELGRPIALARRIDLLFDAVIAYRVSERESAVEAARWLASTAGFPGSIGLAAAAIRRRCRP